jgi:TfoX N-terminal domain
MTPADHELAQRVRAILAASPHLERVEKNMMGTLTFMVDGNMCCSVGKGRLMVRVGPAAYEKALTEPDVTPLEFGGKAPVGYVCVAFEAVESAKALRSWIDRGLAFTATLPAKAARKAASR